jgi:hypothetical protein
VTDEERIIDTAHGARFRALSHHMKLFLPPFKENQTAE